MGVTTPLLGGTAQLHKCERHGCVDCFGLNTGLKVLSTPTTQQKREGTEVYSFVDGTESLQCKHTNENYSQRQRFGGGMYPYLYVFIVFIVYIYKYNPCRY